VGDSGRWRGRWAGRGGVAVLLVLAACQGLRLLGPPSVPRGKGPSTTIRGPAFQADSTPADSAPPWPFYNGSLGSTRYSPLTELDTANVARLALKCRYHLGERTPFQSGPVVAQGTIYVTTAEWTYAIDAQDCRLRWKHRYRYGPRPAFDLGVNRGVAYAAGTLYRGSNDARLYALDARTGQERWNVAIGSVRKGETVPAAPVVWEGRVYVGNAGGDNLGVIGRVMAFDTATGGLLWSQSMVSRSGAAAASWPPEKERFPRTGGATWVSYTLDTLTGRLYVGTGNPAPDFLAAVRPGDNLLTTSVVILDARDGSLVGWRQLVTGDIHDWDLAAPPMLLRAARGPGLVLQAGKDGLLHALEEKNGSIRWQTAVTTRHNMEAPFTSGGTRFCPGVNGGVEWNGPAFAQTAGLVVVGAIDWCTTVRVGEPEELDGRTGLPWTGSAQRTKPFGEPDSLRRGWLTAVDPRTGEIRWQKEWSTPLVAGVTATAGGLILTGDLNGTVLAFSASDGALLWRRDTGLPVGGGVVTYLVQGRQQVAVAAGMHAPLTWKLESPPAELLVFALPDTTSP
jgi:alcohol dehydrogenase (cytochrome c)